ncbi:proteasome maturation factor UMP1-domain-containing protein [Kalaharituber pfeilii]|nr:proteasome maturation factor UMP1-domain-containing protein [Kalaharituber pfeilii]
MSSNLRLAPPPPYAAKISHVAPSKGAPSAPTSVHDTMREGLPHTVATLNIHHPLEHRLKGWEEQQEKIKMEGLRRVFGLGEPIRRGMEMKIVGSDFRPKVLGGPSNLHLDILKNKDWTLDWDDIFTDCDRDMPSFHDEMETRLRMKW